jgi:tRNA(Arg) A34 adenosine deaminase TadA
MSFPEFSFHLPEWVGELVGDPSRPLPTQEERMHLAIRLAAANVSRGTGGPFGAAVFDMENHTLVAPGVNMVVPTNCSVLHAEVVALVLAQQVHGHFDLSSTGRECELVTSTEPCAMCLGAVTWSGVRRVACGARDGDARQIGFDEGAKPQHWVRELTQRGIEVVLDVCREQAIAVLRAYVERGGKVYNPQRGGQVPHGRGEG